MKKKSARLKRIEIPKNSLLILSDGEIGYLIETLEDYTIKTECLTVIGSAEGDIHYTQQRFCKKAAELGKVPEERTPICYLLDCLITTIKKSGSDLSIILCNWRADKIMSGTVLTLSASVTS